jgi:F-type H+-transporting ATPase subunit delta
MSKINTRQIAAVERYANALFQLAKEAKVLDSVSNELVKIKEILQEDKEVLSAILNPSISKTNKIKLFDIIVEKNELSKLVSNFIGVIVKKNRVNYFLEIIKTFENLLASLKGERVATVSSAFALTDAQLDDINSKLKDKFNADFNIQLNIEPELIGGLKIQVGSQMIDSSIKNQLQLLKEKMKEVA